MTTRRSMLAPVLLAALAIGLAAATGARAEDDGQAWDPMTQFREARADAITGTEAVDELPPHLRGKAVVMPVGRPDDGMRAVLYVPSYYDPGRAWPVLIEGVPPGYLTRALGQFRPEAERHGFILLAVEYLYHKGRETSRHDAWSRDGGTTVTTYERDAEDFNADMQQDERVLKRLVTDLRRHYNIERRAVGITGFLGAGVMAYRMAIGYPDLICAAVGRSSSFSQNFLPRITYRARQVPIFVIYGEKEAPETLRFSEQAIIFFRSRRFARVSAEEIPFSGVDSRPEIAANAFRSIVDQVVGDRRTAFDRAACLAGRLLEGTLPDDALTADGRPVTGRAALARLNTWREKFPNSDLAGQARLLAARLHLEACDQREPARKLLREFHQPPLSNDPAAPAALLYLAENLLDPTTDAEEMRRTLRRVIDRGRGNPPLAERAGQLLQAVDDR